MVALLSQYNFIRLLTLIFKSGRTILIHNSSQIPTAITQNSTSILDLATIDYFLLLM